VKWVGEGKVASERDRASVHLVLFDLGGWKCGSLAGGRITGRVHQGSAANQGSELTGSKMKGDELFRLIKSLCGQGYDFDGKLEINEIKVYQRAIFILQGLLESHQSKYWNRFNPRFFCARNIVRVPYF
jgi:hypothetical protein